MTLNLWSCNLHAWWVDWTPPSRFRIFNHCPQLVRPIWLRLTSLFYYSTSQIRMNVAAFEKGPDSMKVVHGITASSKGVGGLLICEVKSRRKPPGPIGVIDKWWNLRSRDSDFGMHPVQCIVAVASCWSRHPVTSHLTLSIGLDVVAFILIRWIAGGLILKVPLDEIRIHPSKPSN